IDAAKHLALAGDGLRVLHGGRDEVVEVDVLDVEGLAHVGAARAQELRHGSLIGGTIESGRHGSLFRRHLAQRQLIRKYLDEEGFHGDSERIGESPARWKALSCSAVPLR